VAESRGAVSSSLAIARSNSAQPISSAEVLDFFPPVAPIVRHVIYNRTVSNKAGVQTGNGFLVLGSARKYFSHQLKLTPSKTPKLCDLVVTGHVRSRQQPYQLQQLDCHIWCRGWESNPHDLTVNGF